MTPATPPPELEVHAWAEVGLSNTLSEVTDDAGSRVSLDMARLKLGYSQARHGGTLQVSARDGIVQLLDAVVHVGPWEQVTLRAGQLKTPLSRELGVPLPQLVLPTRALLVGMAPRRELGLEGAVHAGHAVLRLGVFDPASDLLVTGPGVRAIAAVDVELPAHLDVHAAGTTWMRDAEAQRAMDPDHTPGWDDEADVGVGYHHAGTELALEGLVAHGTDAPRWDTGVTALAAHRFGLGDDVELEPAAGWDAARIADEELHRVTGAFNVHQEDWNTVASMSWESSYAEARFTEHVARVQLQAGF